MRGVGRHHHHHIIESKKNDTRSIEQKRKLWVKLAENFVSFPGTQKRDYQQLKKCWENLKSKAKKAVRNEKMETMRTGGGTFTSQRDPVTERIEAMIPSQMHPLPNPFDDDAAMHGDETLDEEKENDVSDIFLEAEETPTASNVDHVNVPEKPTTITPKKYVSECPSSKSRSMIRQSEFGQAKDSLVQQAQIEHHKKLELLDLQIRNASEAHQKQMQLIDLQMELLRVQIAAVRSNPSDVSASTPTVSGSLPFSSIYPTYHNL